MDQGTSKEPMNLFPCWVHLFDAPWSASAGILDPDPILSRKPVLFQSAVSNQKITSSGNEIDLDPDHPKERHPYSRRNARKPTLDYCTYLPGKTLPKESWDPVDNLYPCYSWHHCILHMKVSVEMRPQLWRTRNRNHNVKLLYNIKFGHPTTLTILKWHFEWKILLWSPSIGIANPHLDPSIPPVRGTGLLQWWIQDSFRRGVPLRNGVTDWWPDINTNTSCIQKLLVILRGGREVCTPCTLPLDTPLY